MHLLYESDDHFRVSPDFNVEQFKNLIHTHSPVYIVLLHAQAKGVFKGGGGGSGGSNLPPPQNFQIFF